MSEQTTLEYLSESRASDAARGDLVEAQRTAGHGRGFGFWLAIGWLAVVLVCAVAAPWLPLRDPLEPDFASLKAGPSASHLLGTDALGRDILARTVHGARASVVIAGASVLIATLAGGFLGLVAGYYGRFLSTLIVRAMDVMLAFPGLVLALALTAFLGASIRNLSIAIGVMAIPAFMRVTRASTLQVAQREYVLAARSLGARDARVILREIVPNVALPIVTFGLLFFGVAIVVEGGLSFLGLGVPPPTPTWGGMIAAGQDDLRTAPQLVLIPSAVLLATVLSLNVVAERLRGGLEGKGSAL